MGKGPTAPRGFGSLGVSVSQTLGGRNVGGGLNDTVRRGLLNDKVGGSNKQTISGLSGGTTPEEVTPPAAHEFDIELPGPADRVYALTIIPRVSGSASPGTATIEVDDDRIPTLTYATGSGGYSNSSTIRVTGGDTVNVTIAPSTVASVSATYVAVPVIT